MAIANYKQIINVQDFRIECPDLAIHMDSTIQSAIYRSSEFLNMECAGLIAKVWDYHLSGANDPNNDLYRTDTELDYLKSAIITQTSYFINNGNSNNVASDGFSLDGYSFNHNTPTSRPVLAPNVNLYLTEARVYTLWQSGATSNAKSQEQEKQEWQKLLSQEHIWSASDGRYVAKWQEQASDGNIAVVQNHNVMFLPPQDALNNLQVVHATNADKVKDNSTGYYTNVENNNYIMSTNSLATANASWISDLETKQNKLNQTQQEIIDGLRNGGILNVVGAYDSTQTYSLGNIVVYNSILYLSIINNNTQPVTNIDAWQILNYTFDASGYVTSQQFQTLQNQVNNLQAQHANFATLNTEQTITAKKTLNLANEVMAIRTSGNEAKFFGFYNGNTRTGVIGAPSISNTDMLVSAENGNLNLSGNAIACDNKRVINVAQPTSNNDATTKVYVDNKFNTLTNALRNTNFLTFSGNWNSSTNYTVGVVVSYNNQLWVCQVNNTNSQPTANNPNWYVLGTGTVNVDLTNYYTKPQTDTLLQSITTNVENLTNQTNTLTNQLSSKADISNLESNYYNRTYIDTNYPINQIAKKNIDNQFNTTQTISASTVLNINNNAILSVVNQQPAKKIVLAKFIQPVFGFRNYTNLTWEIQCGSDATSTEFLKLQSRTNGEGLWVFVEGNKINFNSPTLIQNLQNPNSNTDAANKQYVDTKINTTNTNLTNQITQLQNQVNNIQTQRPWQTFTRNNVTISVDDSILFDTATSKAILDLFLANTKYEIEIMCVDSSNQYAICNDVIYKTSNPTGTIRRLVGNACLGLTLTGHVQKFNVFNISFVKTYTSTTSGINLTIRYRTID